MRSDEGLGFGPVGTIVFIVLLLAFLVWMYRGEYRDCMKVKNDPILCEIYARPR